MKHPLQVTILLAAEHPLMLYRVSYLKNYLRHYRPIRSLSIERGGGGGFKILEIRAGFGGTCTIVGGYGGRRLHNQLTCSPESDLILF